MSHALPSLHAPPPPTHCAASPPHTPPYSPPPPPLQGMYDKTEQLLPLVETLGAVQRMKV